LRRGVALLFAALAASMAALALLVTRAVPPNARHGFAASDASAWALAEAVERVAKGELEACNALERALETLRLDTADRRALPRVFARDPEALVPGTKAAAARCLSAFVDDGSGSNDGSTTARPMRRPFGIERSSSTDLAESALVLSEELAPRQPPPAVPAPAPAALERTVAGVAAEPDGTEPSPPSNDGELDQAAIAQVVRSHSRDVRRCYEKGLRSNPNLSGRVDVTFTIAVSGRVSTARVARSTIGDEAVQACILGVVRGMRFPKPKANVTVNYPYVFARS
jgi:TonB family protein